MNVLTENLPMLLEGTGETLAMVFVSALFAYVIGLPLGVALIVTDKNGLHPMRGVSAVLGWIVNIGRSIPFVILMLVITPLTRLWNDGDHRAAGRGGGALCGPHGRAVPGRDRPRRGRGRAHHGRHDL